MNCRTAHAQLARSADVPLDSAAASALAVHLEGCPHCRSVQTQLAQAAAAWRATAATVSVPDAQTEWHAVRRRLRQMESSQAHREAPTPVQIWRQLLRFAAPATAVAALALWLHTQTSAPVPPTDPTAGPTALTASVARPQSTARVATATTDPTTAPAGATESPWSEFDHHFGLVAHAEYVETENEDASPFVYVDDESGWLIVWASAPPDAAKI